MVSSSAVPLFSAGYRDLVCVVPPGSTLSPGSRLDPAKLGKAPGVRNLYGDWRGYPWHTFEATEAAAQTWDRWGASIGLKADQYPGVDIDCLDHDLAAELE